LIVTLLFAAIHVPQYSKDGVRDYATIVALLMLSLVLTMIRVRTKNLLPCFVLHTVFNGFQAALLVAYTLLQPYMNTPAPQPEIAPTFFISF
jgi:membrane protease YdiL (CAAX protease family)